MIISYVEISKFNNELSLQYHSRTIIGMYKKLSEIKIGQKAMIRSFESDELFLKLMEMGCIPGETIVIEQIAPFKDPISVSVAGYRLSLRLDEADHIIVEELN